MNKKNLTRYGGKLLVYLLTVWCVATFNFFLIRFMPGDPLEHLVGEEDYLYLTCLLYTSQRHRKELGRRCFRNLQRFRLHQGSGENYDEFLRYR